jgi:hypothetical protein
MTLLAMPFRPAGDSAVRQPMPTGRLAAQPSPLPAIGPERKLARPEPRRQPARIRASIA